MYMMPKPKPTSNIKTLTPDTAAERKTIEAAKVRADRAELLREIRKLHDCHVEDAVAIVRAIGGNQGTITPVEEFITSVATLYGHSLKHGYGITPRNLQHFVDEMQENFDDMIAISRRMRDQYPELMNASEPEEEED